LHSFPSGLRFVFVGSALRGGGSAALRGPGHCARHKELLGVAVGVEMGAGPVIPDPPDL
jgi:hypothetical protein